MRIEFLLLSIIVAEEGILISLKVKHPSKADFPMNANEERDVSDSRDLQSKNVHSSIFVTDEGMTFFLL